MNATETKCDLFGSAMTLARAIVSDHVFNEECESCRGEGRIETDTENEYRRCLDCRGDGKGETCFNRFTYLDHLRQRLPDVFESGEFENRIGRFELDAERVARFLYVCLCLESGDNADGDTFRGMAIHD